MDCLLPPTLSVLRDNRHDGKEVRRHASRMHARCRAAWAVMPAAAVGTTSAGACNAPLLRRPARALRRHQRPGSGSCWRSRPQWAATASPPTSFRLPWTRARWTSLSAAASHAAGCWALPRRGWCVCAGVCMLLPTQLRLQWRAPHAGMQLELCGRGAWAAAAEMPQRWDDRCWMHAPARHRADARRHCCAHHHEDGGAVPGHRLPSERGAVSMSISACMALACISSLPPAQGCVACRPHQQQQTARLG